MASEKMTRSLSHQTPNNEQVIAITRLRQESIKFATIMEELVPPGRERALAETNFEQAMMWAIKGIVLPPN